MRALTLILLFLPSVLVAADAAQTLPPDDDFSPGAFFVILVFVALCLVLLGAGIVAALIFFALAALLGAVGILSMSGLVGILRRRFAAGFRALHYQLCVVFLTPCGIAALWIGASLFHLHLRHRYIFLLGLLAGIVAGIVLAFALDCLSRFAYRRITLARTSLEHGTNA